MRVCVVATFLLVLSECVSAQTCQQICDDYKSFARRAGAPQTLGPLLKLYQACMECAKGDGTLECSSLPGSAPNGARCEYKPIQIVPPSGNRQ
jgi:hypothetical protein